MSESRTPEGYIAANKRIRSSASVNVPLAPGFLHYSPVKPMILGSTGFRVSGFVQVIGYF
jgi:hypothetical protein